ncbi:hypothetical protein ABZ807_09345 [Micromonospora sp. NPDC047548]|uniref:hypothetical protein n=1 Tax=Micromonospora sp. NPDC047548 TaxID=3155624 RepID=UPI0033C23861
MLNDLLQASLFLLPIGAGVALLVILGRDDQADVHDLTDYAPGGPVIEGEVVVLPASRRTWPVAAVDAPAAIVSGEIPTWRQLVVDRAVPTLSDAAVRGIADEWLREIAAEQRAKVDIRPRVVSTADRDMTGAFPVVRAA